MKRTIEFLLLLLALGCGQPTDDPTRPQAVPIDALWVGGADGGVFVKVDMHASGSSGTYAAQIFAETTGDTLYDGDLILDPPGGIPPDIRNARTFGGWDGDALLLADGRRLTARPSAP